MADPADPQGAVLFEAQNRATATKFMWPIAERGLRRRLRYVEAPTLVVHGTSDGLLPMAYAEELAGLIDGAELVRIADAGHYPMIEQEHAFLDAVTAFLDRERTVRFDWPDEYVAYRAASCRTSPPPTAGAPDGPTSEEDEVAVAERSRQNRAELDRRGWLKQSWPEGARRRRDGRPGTSTSSRWSSATAASTTAAVARRR